MGQICANPTESLAENRTTELLHKLKPFLKPGQELSLVDGLPSVPFSKDTSGLRANAYYFGQPAWLEAWFRSVHRYPELKQRWHDLIDVDAGSIATGDATIEDVGWELFRLMLEVASGRETWAEHWKLTNSLALFNPGPVT